jgi:hypothetical protein
MRTGLLVLPLLLVACGASQAPLAASPPVARPTRADELLMRTPDSSRSPGLVLGQLQPVPVRAEQSREATLTGADHATKRRRKARMANLEGVAK